MYSSKEQLFERTNDISIKATVVRANKRHIDQSNNCSREQTNNTNEQIQETTKEQNDTMCKTSNHGTKGTTRATINPKQKRT
jgi:hypothetical protein